MITKSLLFIYSLIFILVWIFINNLSQNIKITLLILLVLGVLFFVYYFIYKRFLNIFIVSFIWFIIWSLMSQINIFWIKIKENELYNYFDNKNHELLIEIKDIKEINENSIDYIWKIIYIDSIKIKNNINIIISWNNFELEKWYLIKTNSKLIEFKSFDSFSYKKYMYSKNIYFKAYLNKFEIIKKRQLNKIEKSIIILRKKIIKTIYEIYPKDEAIFLAWILIWARESIPEETKQNFNNSWLTHFIAVSWFNITILIIFISYILKYFPTFIKIISITIFIVLFTILVWESAPVIRASIMWLLWYYIITSGRKWNIFILILVTAVIMWIYSPFSLNYDVSLHLSFLALIWIIYTKDFFDKIFYFLPNFLEIKTAFSLTISALVLTLPIMIINFWQFSTLAFLANILVSWTIPIAMLLWFISIIVYFVYQPISIIIWYFTWILLKWDMIIVQFFGSLSFSVYKINFGVFKYHFEILYFIILIFLILWYRKRDEI